MGENDLRIDEITKMGNDLSFILNFSTIGEENNQTVFQEIEIRQYMVGDLVYHYVKSNSQGPDIEIHSVSDNKNTMELYWSYEKWTVNNAGIGKNLFIRELTESIRNVDMNHLQKRDNGNIYDFKDASKLFMQQSPSSNDELWAYIDMDEYRLEAKLEINQPEIESYIVQCFTIQFEDFDKVTFEFNVSALKDEIIANTNQIIAEIESNEMTPAKQEKVNNLNNLITQVSNKNNLPDLFELFTELFIPEVLK